MGSGALRAEAQRPRSRPNVLFMMTDQQRWDALGCAGNRAVHTPNIDRIARQGAWFSHAYSSTPTCTPARAGLLTGMSPWNHGMIGYFQVAERYPVEMQRLMGQAGYHTYAIGKLHYHPQRNVHGFDGALLDESGRVITPGFVSDYRQWFKEVAPDRDPDVTGVGWNDYEAVSYKLPEELHPTHWTGQQAVEFINGYRSEQPFFLKVSFARPHSPYDPPQRFFDGYRDADMPAPWVGDWCAQNAEAPDPVPSDTWYGDLGVAQAKRSRRGYYGSVSFIDEEVGRILDALERRGMLDNTLVIFTSDHGDMLGDHHLWRKSYAYEASAHIPLIVRWPESGFENMRRGRTLEHVAELRDILPTCLDAAGAEIPDEVDGRSLLDPVRGQAQDWRKWIDMEHDICYSPRNHWNSLTDGRWKYIYHAQDGSEQLFDLKNDPGEERDLAKRPDYGDMLSLWRNQMVSHLEVRGEEWVRAGKLVPRPQSILLSPNYPGKPVPRT